VWRRRGPLFVYPVLPAPRTAVLSTVFRGGGAVRIFDPASPALIDDLKKFAPESVAATLPQLDALAGSITLSHALIVLRSESDSRLADSDYDHLWRAFRVPAFEQIVAEDGTLLAAECEAHDGLHIESDRLSRDPHEIDESACPCGRPGARIARRKQRGVAAGVSI